MENAHKITIEELMQHADTLYRFALSRVKDHHTAEDIVQDCLSAAWGRIDSFQGKSTLSTWLIGIMKFKIIDYFRKSKRTPTDQALDKINDDQAGDSLDLLFNSNGSWKVDPNHGLDMLQNSPDQLTSRGEVMAWIKACMEKLPDRLRTLFLLREIDGLDVPSAASAAGVTPGSAAVLLTRSRLRMRSCLQENGIQP